MSRFGIYSTMKLKNTAKIKREIVSIIDKNQDIKRYCKYMTKTPLFNIGESYDGKFINQPELSESIVGSNLMPYMFTDDIINNAGVFIFVSLYDTYFGDVVDNNIYMVNILCPVTHNELEPYGEERVISIAHKIIDILDGRQLDGMGLGEISFRNTKFSMRRLGKNSNHLIATAMFNVETSSDRNGGSDD